VSSSLTRHRPPSPDVAFALSVVMFESISAFLPSNIPTALPELVRSSLTSFSERKASIQQALAEVCY
jgi:hypothetical protein